MEWSLPWSTMSRSEIVPTPKFITNFPIHSNVCGVYLKKIVIVNKVFKEHEYPELRLSFLHLESSSWITKFISLAPLEAFKDESQYKKAKLSVTEMIENLMACYLTGSHMKHIMFQTQASGLHDIMEEIIEALNEKHYWDKEVCLKTGYNKYGTTSVARFAPYMSYPDNAQWELKYSNFEINNNLKIKNESIKTNN